MIDYLATYPWKVVQAFVLLTVEPLIRKKENPMTFKTSIAVAAALALMAGTAAAEFKDMTVNGQVITKATQERLAASTLAMGQDPHAIQDPNFEDNVRNMLIEAQIMADVARKEGLDKQKDVQDEIAMQTNMILMNHAIANYAKNVKVTDQEITDEYNKEKAKWGDTEIMIRHIALKDKVEADVLIKSLDKGGDFAKLAAEKSLDEDTKAAGGLVEEWLPVGRLQTDLSAAVKGLKKGEYTKTAVQTPKGFEVIKIEDVRPAENFPTLGESKKKIEHVLMQRKIQAYVHEKVISADVKK